MRWALGLLFAAFVSCGAANSNFNDVVIDDPNLPTRWESLPIAIATNNETEARILELYNGYFGTEIFVQDPYGVVIDLSGVMPQGYESALGAAILEYSDEFIIAGTIYINTPYTSTTTTMYRCTIEHELGHILGADHIGSVLMAAAADCSGGFFSAMNRDDVFPQWVRETYGLDYVEPVFPEYGED